MKILTWNLDGLDTEFLFERTMGAIPVINDFDVIFLQEVVLESKEMIVANLPDFHHFTGASIPDYFVMILVRKSIAKEVKQTYMPFSNSQMARGLLVTEVETFDFGNITFGTSHLESMKDYARARMEQFANALDHFKQSKQDHVIFGGDLNLRDSDLKLLSPEMQKYFNENFNDAWIQTGSKSESKFTWDLVRNDNKQLPNGFKPRCRFDRLYLSNSLSAKSFDLVGTIKSGPKFISDHFALAVRI